MPTGGGSVIKAWPSFLFLESGMAENNTIHAGAMTPVEFCARYQISRSTLFKLWSEGKGPRRFRAGRAVRITLRAAEEWAGDVEPEERAA